MSSAFNNYNNIYKFYDNFEVPSSLASTNVGLSTYNGWQVSAANKFWIESNSTIGMKMGETPFDNHGKIYEGYACVHVWEPTDTNIYAFKNIGTNLTNYYLQARIYKTAGIAFIMFKSGNKQYRIGFDTRWKVGTVGGWGSDTIYTSRLNQFVKMRAYINPYGVTAWTETNTAFVGNDNYLTSFDDIGFGVTGSTKEVFFDEVILYPLHLNTLDNP